MRKFKIILKLIIAFLVALIAIETYLFIDVMSIKNIDKQFDKAIEYYRNGNYIKASRHLVGVYSSPIISEFDVFCAYRVGLLDAIGAHEKATSLLKKSLESYPDNSLLNAMMGIKYLDEKNYPEAEKYLIKSATYNGITASTYLKLGEFYSKFDEPKRAISAYSEAIKLASKLKSGKEKQGRINVARLARADAYRQIGDFKNALNDYSYISKQKHNPCISFAYIHYSISICKYKLGDYDGAMIDIDKAISMSKKPYANYFLQKSYIYFDKKDYEKFELYFKKALELASPEEEKNMLKIKAEMEDYKKSLSQKES